MDNKCIKFNIVYSWHNFLPFLFTTKSFNVLCTVHTFASYNKWLTESVAQSCLSSGRFLQLIKSTGVSSIHSNDPEKRLSSIAKKMCPSISMDKYWIYISNTYLQIITSSTQFRILFNQLLDSWSLQSTHNDIFNILNYNVTHNA